MSQEFVRRKQSGVQTSTDGPELAAIFRSAFRRHPAGVAIVSAGDINGPVGLTVSSVASVSVDPPALAFSVTSSGGAAGRILSASEFVVNLLVAADVEIARNFSVVGAPRFAADQAWEFRENGTPWLATAASALLCRASTVTEVGSSRLVAAEVVEELTASDGHALVYRDRAFYWLPEDSTL